MGLWDYYPSKDQGLWIGNTGTVRTIYPNCYGVETDGAQCSLSSDGEGWAFEAEHLVPLTPPHEPGSREVIEQLLPNIREEVCA